MPEGPLTEREGLGRRESGSSALPSQLQAFLVKPGRTGLQGPPPLARVPCAAAAVMLSVTWDVCPPCPLWVFKYRPWDGAVY